MTANPGSVSGKLRDARSGAGSWTICVRSHPTRLAYQAAKENERR